MPDLRNQSTDSTDFELMEPHQWLEMSLKDIINPEVFELMTNRLRDSVIEKDPLFRWCKKVIYSY